MKGEICVTSSLVVIIIPGQIQWPANVSRLHQITPDFEINRKSYTLQKWRKHLQRKAKAGNAPRVTPINAL